MESLAVNAIFFFSLVCWWPGPYGCSAVVPQCHSFLVAAAKNGRKAGVTTGEGGGKCQGVQHMGQCLKMNDTSDRIISLFFFFIVFFLHHIWKTSQSVRITTKININIHFIYEEIKKKKTKR